MSTELQLANAEVTRLQAVVHRLHDEVERLTSEVEKLTRAHRDLATPVDPESQALVDRLLVEGKRAARSKAERDAAPGLYAALDALDAKEAELLRVAGVYAETKEKTK